MRNILLHLLTATAIFVLSHSAHSDTIDVQFNFPVPNPAEVTINVGDSVRFLGDGPTITHPLEQVDSPTSNTATAGGFTATSKPFVAGPFNTPGTYYYRCTSHGVAPGGQMRGSITVSAVPVATPTATPQPTAEPTAEPSPELPTPNCSAKPEKPVITIPAQGATIRKERVALKWDEVDCATTYRLTVRRDSKSGQIVDKKNVTVASYKTVKLSKKRSYFWAVKACGAAGCSGNSTSSFLIK